LLPKPRTAPPAPELASVDVGGGSALVRLRAGVSLADLQSVHQDVERSIKKAAQSSTLAYDLVELTLMDDSIKDAILAFVMKNRASIAKVAFASPRAMVRAGALVVAQRASVPAKIFAGVAPMLGWLQGGAS
jgi:hypothetical protein